MLTMVMQYLAGQYSLMCGTTHAVQSVVLVVHNIYCLLINECETRNFGKVNLLNTNGHKPYKQYCPSVLWRSYL